MNSSQWVRQAGLGLTAAVLIAGCATKPVEPLNIERLETISATVEAVDVKKRLVSLRGPKGKVATIEVAPEVRNLAQVHVGDQLVVRYYTSLGAVVKPDGAPSTVGTVDQAAGAVRAEAGAKPGVALGSMTTATVVIQIVDKKNHTVIFSGADGFVRTVQVQDPEAQKFVATLKPGDHVDLTYTEAVAVSVESVK